MPVIPATQEAKAGEALEPRRRRLQRAKIMPLHSSLGNKSKTPSPKKKRNEREAKESLATGSKKETGGSWDEWAGLSAIRALMPNKGSPGKG